MNRSDQAFSRYISAHWYSWLTALFIAVIMSSTISVFEGFWWKETFAIAYYTIFAAAALQILLPAHYRAAKLFLQVLAAFAITARFARIDWPAAPGEGMGERIEWLKSLVVELQSFILVSVSLLLVYALFASWAVTRRRMFGVIGVSLAILTVADSFTPIWLWDNVAVVVFVGLLWLIANHLSTLQRIHPGSWKELLKYPLQLIAPTAVVLTLLMLVGLNMPAIGPMLKDPYTIWKQSRGEQVRVFLGDKTVSSILSPKAAGNANSGYSRSDAVLGGGFDYDYSPMMTVSTSNRSYWRGETKSIYTGQGWEPLDILEGRINPIKAQAVQRDEELDSGIDRSLAETVEIHQIVSMLREDEYPILFGAAPISKVHWIGDENSDFNADLSWIPEQWELRWTGRSDRQYPESYSVTSTVTLLDEDALRGAKSAMADESKAALYLQLPDNVPERVEQLAAQITEAATNDYDKARFLESYLRLNYTYSNKPDLSKLDGSRSNDFVDQFLFELKEGYCDYFSTSMTVMARSIGLPARWVKGFAPGVLPMDGYGISGGIMDMEDMNPEGAGTYTVRNSDAHSWVEIYFEGYGWIPFEPTAGFSFPYYTPNEDEIVPETPETPATEEPEAPAAPSQSSYKPWGWAALIALVAAAAALLIVFRKRIAVSWRKFRHGSYTANDRIVLETQRLLRICKKRGMKHAEHETLREAVIRWTHDHKRLKREFIEVLEGFEQAKYSAAAASDEEAEQFIHKVKALIGELK